MQSCIRLTTPAGKGGTHGFETEVQSGASFNRMRRSLEKAISLIDQK
jgi:hypothetical protein